MAWWFTCQVLLFSTMTRLLDILEDFLEWRGVVSVRLDGATAAEERGAVCLTFLTMRWQLTSGCRHKACAWKCVHMDRMDSCCACTLC